MSYAGEAMKRNQSVQALGLPGRKDPILDADDDLGRNGDIREPRTNVDRLRAIREQRVSEPASAPRPSSPRRPLAQSRVDQRRTKRSRIGDEFAHPRA